MTTIAYDAELGIVAADSQDTEGNRRTNCQKLFRIEGHIVCTAGGSYAGLLFVRWFSEWDKGEPDWDDYDDHPDLVNLDLDEDFECLVIRPDKSCYTVNRLFVPYELDLSNRFFTLGSGGGLALGAMEAGKKPRAAVRIAKRHDINTGGPIVTMKV